MRRITLNDGTVFDGCTCGMASGVLWCYLQGVTFTNALAAFTDPQKTSRIVFAYGEMEDTHDGYTTMIAAVDDRHGTISIGLIRPGA